MIRLLPHLSDIASIRGLSVGHEMCIRDRVGTAVTGQRVHVAGGLLEFPQVFRRIVYEEILVHDMVAREQYPYRCGKGEAAVAADVYKRQPSSCCG